MRRLFIIFMVLAFASCKKESQEPFGKSNEITESTSEGESAKAKTPADLGKEIFEGRGNCAACHQPDQKIIGPSIKEIAKIYKDKNGNMVDFLKGNAKPIVDPSQFSVMETNLSITKAMSEEELKALEAYMYNNSN